LRFSVYVGTLLPVLLLFGGVAEPMDAAVVLAGIACMLGGRFTLLWAHGLTQLIVGIGAALAVGVMRAVP